MGTVEVVEVGRLLGDPTRVAMLDALFDGRAYTVSELARHVQVAPSTASEHLARLFDGGFLAIEPQGRHRYYRLRDANVATLLESFFQFGSTTPVKRSTKVPADMAFARSCYDHLAGTVAVSLSDHLVACGAIEVVDTITRLTTIGHQLFEPLGLDTAQRSGQRVLVRRCLDWTERRPHLAGSLPAALLDHMLANDWCSRRRRGRTLQITNSGRVELHTSLGFVVP